MQHVYRTMRADPDGQPKIDRSARALGVRVEGKHVDVIPDVAGYVHPGRGMSVTVDDPAQMSVARRPWWIRGGDGLGGDSEDALFVVEPARLEGRRPDPAALAAVARAAAAAGEALSRAAATGDLARSRGALEGLEAAVRDLGNDVRPLRARIDRGAHAVVEPAVPRPLAAYERDLAATRPEWRKVAPPHGVESR